MSKREIEETKKWWLDEIAKIPATDPQGNQRSTTQTIHTTQKLKIYLYLDLSLFKLKSFTAVFKENPIS